MKISSPAPADRPHRLDGWLRDVSDLFPAVSAAVAEQVTAAREVFSFEPHSRLDDGGEDYQVDRRSVPHWRPHSLWLGALAGIVLAAGSSAQSDAAPSLAGHWDMAAENSQFEERVVGPAPDQAVMTVTRDDADHLSYQLVESRSGVVVARGAYDLSFKGGPSWSAADGRQQSVVAAKDGAGAISIVAGGAGAYHAVVRLRQTGPDTALIDHVLEGPQGEIELERFAMVRRASEAFPIGSAEAAAPAALQDGE